MTLLPMYWYQYYTVPTVLVPVLLPMYPYRYCYECTGNNVLVFLPMYWYCYQCTGVVAILLPMYWCGGSTVTNALVLVLYWYRCYLSDRAEEKRPQGRLSQHVLQTQNKRPRRQGLLGGVQHPQRNIEQDHP